MRHGATLAGVLACLFVAAIGLARSGEGGGDDDHKPLPDSRLGTRTAPLLLLSRADVRADLNLTAEQGASAEHEIRELYLRAADLKGKSDAQVLAARRAIDEAQQKWLEAHLSAEQRERLAQIDLQWEGPSALVSRPFVAQTLGLTADQRRTLSKAVAERHRARAAGKNRPEEERALAQKALATLTEEQRSRWKTMLGRPFAVQTARAEEKATR